MAEIIVELIDEFVEYRDRLGHAATAGENSKQLSVHISYLDLHSNTATMLKNTRPVAWLYTIGSAF